MSETFRNLIGRNLDNNLTLGEYLGGTETTAVFQTTFSGQKAAAKLFEVEAARVEAELPRLQQAEKLSHPNLLRALKTGRGEAGGIKFVYVVTEFAEENLAQVLPERALTTKEAQEVLERAIDALAYLHAQGFVHSDLKPANVLAQGDQLKLSVDSLYHIGDSLSREADIHDAPEASGRLSPASDVWSLGMTLVEILTQQLPAKAASENAGPTVSEAVPAPFREIAQHCLLRTPELRWSLEEISAKLRGLKRVVAPASTAPHPDFSTTSVTARPKRSQRPLIMVAVVAMIAAALVVVSRHSDHDNQQQPAAITSQTSTQPVEPAQATSGTTAASQSPPAETAKPQENDNVQQAAPNDAKLASEEPQQRSGVKHITDEDASASDNEERSEPSPEGILHKVMPEVLPAARRSITGKVLVKLALEVNSSGNVVECKLLSSPSKYFARVSEEAARQWKFAPASADSRIWHVEFAFRRSGAEVRSKQQ